MWTWLKRLLLGSKNEDIVKSFDEATADIPHKEFRRIGQRSIETDKIVGSVGRAHELKSNFRYRERTTTGRYRSVEAAMREGKPMGPIKVVRVKRKRRDTEFYVVDGHHRVAEAKRHGLSEMNAEVTDVVIPSEDSADENAKSET